MREPHLLRALRRRRRRVHRRLPHAVPRAPLGRDRLPRPAPFLDPGARWPVAAQIATYAATTAAIEVPILVGYGLLAAHGTRFLPAGRIGLWQDRIAGGALLAVAVWLALR